jgi:hypothetical protein
MMTQITDASATWRSRSISGRASTTIVVSTAVISTPVIITTIPRPACAGAPVPAWAVAPLCRTIARPQCLASHRTSPAVSPAGRIR